ncbi:MAG: aldehyde dehydrogenase family protein [Caldilineaceae bacterium]
MEFGLSAGVVTNDLKRAFEFANRIDAGVVKVNEPTTGLALQSALRRLQELQRLYLQEQGQAAIEFYTRTKTIYMGHG